MIRRAVSFLTPLGGARAPSPATLDWFPLVGATIGLAVGGTWWLAARAWAPAVAAGVTLAADAMLTGYLHLDGLADAADGLLPPMPTERRLEVMADPAVGAFGIVTLVLVVFLRFGALASTTAAPLVVSALWCGSRSGMAVIARTLRYARPGGLATAFVDSADGDVSETGWSGGASGQRPLEGSRGKDRSDSTAVHGPLVPAAVGLAVAVGLALFGRGAPGLAAVGAEVIGMTGVALLARRRIGGFTGDVLGAAGVIGETLGLLVLAAKW